MRFVGTFFLGKPNLWHLLVALGLTACAFAWRFQTYAPPPCGGMGDCVKYLRMTELFAEGRSFPSPIEYPFNLRVGMPWLVSLFGGDFVQSYARVSAACSLAFVVVLHAFARALGLKAFEFAFLALWFLAHPLGLAFPFAVAASVDPLAQAMLGLAALLFVQRRRVAFWLALGAALLVKETFVFVALVAILAELASAVFAKGKDLRILREALLSCAGGVLVVLLYKLAEAFVLPHLFPKSQAHDISSIHILKWWTLQAVENPARILVWIGACFCATGFFSVLVAGKWGILERLKDPLDARKLVFLALGGGGYIAFGLVAGADMSRIAFSGAILFLGLFFYVARARNLSFIQEFWAFSASLALALFYTRFFPSTFEYGYYASRDVGPTAFFVLLCAAVWGAVWGAGLRASALSRTLSRLPFR